MRPNLAGLRRVDRTVRWAAVLIVIGVLVSLPTIVAAWPVSARSTNATQLLARIQRSSDVPYSGYAEAAGGLVLPVSTELGSLADLFGGRTDLRVWYRDADNWRSDSVAAFGESDLYADRGGTWSWNYESNQAVRVTSDQAIRARLPRPADLLPPELARRLLSQAQPAEASPLPAARIAGHTVPGLRVRPSDPRSTVRAVDVWAVADTGLPVKVAVYGDSSTPVISTTFLDLDLTTPAASTTSFTPPAGAKVQVQDAPDLAATIDRFGHRRPPAELAGLPRNSDTPDLGAIGIYGRGVTFLAAVPLPGNTADQLRDQLAKAAGSSQDAAGVHLTIGPLAALLTPTSGPIRPWLLIGSVTAATLNQAATQLPTQGAFR